VLAHRGLALDAPENTLLAFAKAIAVGATHIETDVHVSADGVAMISHDPDLRRVAGREAAVVHLTSHELRRVDLGHGQGFASLAEALDAFPDTRFNIDLKVPGVVDAAVEAIRAANAIPRVLIGAFGASRRLRAVRMLPGVATSVSSRGAVAAVAAAGAGNRRGLRRILRDVQAVQLPETVLGMKPFRRRSVAAFHAAGVEVHAWTINDPAAMQHLLDAGVDGIITDRCDVAIPLVRARTTKAS
jgi:glycerophosphoryl diester phosphodiesterase